MVIGLVDGEEVVWGQWGEWGRGTNESSIEKGWFFDGTQGSVRGETPMAANEA